MGASSPADSATNHPSSFRHMREESLLRSFSAIQHRSSADERLNRDRRGCRRGNRRVSQGSSRSVVRQHQAVGHAAGPSPTSCAVTPPLGAISDARDIGMPTLPFMATELRRDSSGQQQRQQRRYCPIAADFAQEMANGLAEERQSPRRRSVTLERPSGLLSQHTSTFPAPPAPPSQAHHKGLRRDYSIGESLRDPSHMIVKPSTSRAVAAADTLDKHDFAFIKRSDGSYSYAILAYRTTVMEGTEGIAPYDIEECMVFVMTEAGSTKMIRKRHWGQLVRLASTEGLPSSTPATGSGRRSPRSLDEHIRDVREHSVLLCQDVQEVAPPQRCEDGWALDTPLSVIAFVPGADEECSLISSVSHRAMLLRRQC